MPTEQRIQLPPGPPARLRRVAGLGCLAVLTYLILEGIFLLLPSCTVPRASQPMGRSALPTPTSPPYITGASISLSHAPGSSPDEAVYTPSDVYVPAHSLVTLTIRNYDLSASPLPAGSPSAVVRGIQGSATMDGRPYAALDPARVAHTFTMLALHLNVPIPAEGAPGASFVTVTFTFRTGAAGVYRWQCFAPCGTGPEGKSGPMGTLGDMMGNLIVQG